MAAAIKAVNAKIRSNKLLDYVCSTRESTSLPFYSLGGRCRDDFHPPLREMNQCEYRRPGDHSSHGHYQELTTDQSGASLIVVTLTILCYEQISGVRYQILAFL